MIKAKSNCPVCEGEIIVTEKLEESEIINCEECENRLVVESVTSQSVVLAKAPEIEEDWGE